MNYKLVFIACIFLFIRAGAQTRNSILLFCKQTSDSVQIRWHFTNPEEWKKNINKGMYLYRRDLSNNTVTAVHPRAIKPFDFKLWVYYEYKIKDSIKGLDRVFDQNTMVVLSMQDPVHVPFKSNNTEKYSASDSLKMQYLAHSLATFNTLEAAYVGGLYYVDKKITKGVEYEYTLINRALGKDSVVARCTTKKNKATTPEIIGDLTNNKSTVLKWRLMDTTYNMYPYYEVFRSDFPDKNYTQLGGPINSMFRNFGSDSLLMFYRDTSLIKGKTYYYKIRAKDIFWTYTDLSKPYKVTEKTLLSGPPILNSVKTILKKQNIINWSLPNDVEIKSVQIYRSTYYDTLYTALSPALTINANIFTDDKPLPVSYYKVMIAGNAGDTLWSSPAAAFIADSIPPAMPVINSAICDSQGIVKIKWKHANESDLMYVRIFKANDVNDEFSAFKTLEIMDSLITDTITLATLSENLYYKIQLLDKTYNTSQFSDAVKVIRPDTIPPTNPIFISYTSDSSGVSLRWANSKSKDLVKTSLYRRLKGETSWKVFKTFEKDTSNYFTFKDTTINSSIWYQYALSATDDANLTSTLSQTIEVRAYETGVRGRIQNATVTANPKKKLVKLTWKCTDYGVSGFLIYRAKNNVGLELIGRVETNEREYYDSKVSPGNTYQYRIKAVFEDNRESPFSEEMQAEF